MAKGLDNGGDNFARYCIGPIAQLVRAPDS